MFSRYRPYLSVALAAFLLFSLPPALFLFKFSSVAPFYFLAQDSFYYLSIALHSRGVPFFTINGLYPTNGFHPLWQWVESVATRTAFFRLDGPQILQRLWGADLLLVAVAVGLWAAVVYREVRRPWIAIIAVCPGLFWLLVGAGSPAHLNNWTYINGMETGVELVCLACAVALFGTNMDFGLRFVAAVVCLGFMVLSRLDDVFFLAAFLLFAVQAGPRKEWGRRLAAFALPGIMIAVYLLYNHRTVGVWLPVSGAAKAGLGYRAGLGETLRLLKGWPFWSMQPNSVAFQYALIYGLVAQMLGPVAIALLYLVRGWRGGRRGALLVQALAVGTLLKALYNFAVVPLGYQGAWYYGASIATANLILAAFLAEVVDRWQAGPDVQGHIARSEAGVWIAPFWARFPGRLRGSLRWVGTSLALLALSFVSFNTTASRASQYGFERTKLAYDERAQVRAALLATGHPLFLEFQDGELSFATGLPSISGFGLAGDPEAARAQKEGRFFDLLRRRGVTIAAASGTYPWSIEASRINKAIYPVWGFDREEIRRFRFQPFWTDSTGDVVLYRIESEAR